MKAEKEIRDYGTPELHKKHKVRRNKGITYVEDQLRYDVLYHQCSLITENMYDAARRLHYLWSYAGLDTMATARYDRPSGSAIEEMVSELGYDEEWEPLQIFCEKSYRAAIRSLYSGDVQAIQDLCLYNVQNNKITEIRNGLADLHKHFEKVINERRF